MDDCKNCIHLDTCEMWDFERKKNNGCISFYPKFTNADKIRSMSDEELADCIFGVSTGSVLCSKCSDSCYLCELSEEHCKKKMLDWLQAEAE